MKRLSAILGQDKGHWVGDGFPVRSIFSYNERNAQLTPFLLLDYAGPMEFTPTEKRRGVGEHPHRGFETVTIVYSGEVEHRDSSGGGGIISAGDVQWMTAAAGLVHEEFHGPDFSRNGGLFEVIQLWVNLPAAHKMAPPAYQGITSERIPAVELDGEAGQLRVISGQYRDSIGPARTFTPVNLWDLRLKAGHATAFEFTEGHTTALFVLRGNITLGSGERIGPARLALMERAGTTVRLEAHEDATILVLDAEPIDEPVVGYGPFVMNTREEIEQAVIDYQSGRMGKLGDAS